MNGTSALFGAVLALAFGLAMTAAASPRPGRLSLAGWLRDGSRGATAGPAGARARNLLIVSQVAMALVLTIGVSESLARYLWPAGGAVGRRLIAVGAEAESDDDAPPWQTVVGVVEDARYREIARGRFDLYVPFTQVSIGLNHLVIRAEGDPARLAPALRSEVQRADSNFVVRSVAPLRGSSTTSCARGGSTWRWPRCWPVSRPGWPPSVSSGSSPTASPVGPGRSACGAACLAVGRRVTSFGLSETLAAE